MSLLKLFDLDGRVAIVTGGGSGIGRQMAEGLAEAGASLLVCARNLERCEQAAEDLSQRFGVPALAARCDVRRPQDIEAAVAAAQGAFGRIDILVNNAGTTWGADAEDYPAHGWQKVIDVNLTGLFLFTQAVGRVMIAAGHGGKIVNIASAAALGGAPPDLMNAVGYNASKGGVISFTRDLAVKWAPHGINVNAIAPGWFPTEMSQALLELAKQRYLDGIPLGRLGGPEDLKGAAVFLASDASAFITGEILVVDGGQTVA